MHWLGGSIFFRDGNDGATKKCLTKKFKIKVSEKGFKTPVGG